MHIIESVYSPLPSLGKFSLFTSSLSFLPSHRVAIMEVGLVSISYIYLITDLAFQTLLDFSRDFDISLMDKVVMAFYTGAGPEVGGSQTSYIHDLS